MPDTSQLADLEQTEVGSYFVANYPPFSVWTPDAVATDAKAALASPAAAGDAAGRSICTSLFAVSAVISVTSGFTPTRTRVKSSSIWICWAANGSSTPGSRPSQGRPFNFVYFGGGTPSFLSTRQLETLVKRVTAGRSWETAEEITFECEPGTITRPKLAAIRGIGVTRLSLGVENFSDRILELNGRAHRSPEIGRVYREARDLGFPQINIDLIAGMLGETDANWTECVKRTVDLAPDSVTIYQMELPYNTTISRDLLKHGGQFDEPVAQWSVKRRWVAEAFEALERAGYTIGSAYTAVKDPATTKFLYRDRLWQGADMVGLGVASFGHINGVHLQNVDTWETYSARNRARRDSARSRVSADRRRADDSRVRAATQARIRPARLFQRQVRRERPRALPRSAGVAPGGWPSCVGRRRRHRDHA